MAESQGYRCAICGLRKKLVVDHDHDTDEVRALLCIGCNSAVGFLGESPQIAEALIDYLHRYGK